MSAARRGRAGRLDRPRLRKTLRHDRGRGRRRRDRAGRRRLRLPRPQRRGQDDVAADDARPDPADVGRGAPVRPRSGARSGRGPRRRGRVRRGARLLPVPERAREPRAARRRSTAAAASGVDGGARDGRADRPRARPRARLLARHAPAARPRGRAAAAAAAARARRADHRPRPGRDARHARARAPPGRRGHHRAALEPPDGRGRGALQPGGDPAASGRVRYEGGARRPARAKRGPLPARCDRPGGGARAVPRRGGHPRRPRRRRRRRVRGRPRRRRGADAARWPRPASASTPSSPRAGSRSSSSTSPTRSRHDPAARCGGRCASSPPSGAPYVGLGAAAAAPVLLAMAIVVHPPDPTDSGIPFFLRFAVESGFAAAAGDAALLGALPVPARDGARRRRHRRGRGSQPHAEDDPHPLDEPQQHLRGQGRRPRSPTCSPRWWRWASPARSPAAWRAASIRCRRSRR